MRDPTASAPSTTPAPPLPRVEPPPIAPPAPVLAPSPPEQPRRARRRWRTHLARRVLVVAAALVALYALVVGVIAPPILRSVARTRLAAALERPVTIDKITIAPSTLMVTVRGFAVRDRDGTPFVSIDELRANLQAISLVRRGLVVRELTILRPKLRLVRDRPHHYNFSDLLAPPPPSPRARPSSPTRYSINNIRILDGSIDFVDRPMQRTHTVRNLLVTLPFVSNLPYDLETYVLPALSARIDDTLVNVGARAKPFLRSREAVVELEVRDLPLAHYFDYLPAEVGFTLPSAMLDAALSLQLRKPIDGAPALQLSGQLLLSDVAADDLFHQPLVRLQQLEIAIAPSQPLDRVLALRQVLLSRPTVWVRRDATGKLQLAHLLPRSAEPSPPAPPWLLTIDELRVSDGTVYLRDAPPGGPFAAALRDLSLAARHVSTARDAAATMELRLRGDAGERLELHGAVALSPPAAKGHLTLGGVPVARYAPYYRPLVLADVDRGTIDLAADYDVHARDRALVHGAELSLTDFAAHTRGDRRELVSIGAAALHGVDADLIARTLTIAGADTQKGRLQIRRAADGRLELATLLPPSPPAPSPSPPSPWSLALMHAAIGSWTLQLTDRVPDPEDPVQVTAVVQSAAIDGYSSSGNAPVRLALRARIDRSGTLAANGNVVPAPLAATLRLDGKNIDIVPFVPYIADRLSLIVMRGALSFAGRLALQTTKDHLGARYQGGLRLDRLVTVDEDDADPLLSWDSLDLAGVDAASAPPALAVDAVALSSFRARLAVSEEGKLNVQGLLARSPGPARSPLPIRVGTVTLQAGTIDYSDDYVQPRFATRLTEVGGRVTGLTSRADTVADVDVRGKLEGLAPLEITGKLNPLAEELSLDLAIHFRDIDLGPLSPYSGKYAGYDIARGKLTLDLAYDVHARKLAAQNKVFIDQLELGHRVQSKHATKLPVKFIVFVLRDRKGEIHLDLPISGSLDDPRFRLGPIILKALLNVLVKAATEPFAMLGSLFGRGPELAWVEFADGRADLDAVARDKLRVIAKVLGDRPGLKLEITGRVGPDPDREALRRLLFERKLKAQKLKALTKQHVTVAGDLDQLTLAPDERERYLAPAYGEEKFPKPRNALGMVKKLPAGEMEKLMLTHIIVDDEELRLLAQRRADAARQALVRAGVASERVFVLEPRTPVAPRHDKARPARVDFTIK